MGGVFRLASLVRVALVVASVSVGLMQAPGFASDARTTRIEPKPVYGATVTIEAGVRVFRPVPSEEHVIINPGGVAPLSINSYEFSRSGAYPVERHR